jgi:drug/metabolite transporter (DMT)-like permease
VQRDGPGTDPPLFARQGCRTLTDEPAYRRALLQIHLCVVLWGFTAILGRLISLPAFDLVWWRMVIVVAAAAMMPAFWRGLRGMGRRTIAIFAGIGLIVAVHWLTFYGSIKLANASVAASCMGVAPVFIAVLEPWILRTRFDPRDLLIGVVAVPGVMFVVGGTPEGMRVGIAIGIVSAFLVALFGVLNKRYVRLGEPIAVTGLELASGAAFLTLIAAATPGLSGAMLQIPGARDALLLMILSIGCTLLPFSLSLVALRHLSAFSAQLAVSLEPVYAIVLAIVLLGEQRELGPAFYLGVAIILGSVFAHTALKLRTSAS